MTLIRKKNIFTIFSSLINYTCICILLHRLFPIQNKHTTIESFFFNYPTNPRFLTVLTHTHSSTTYIYTKSNLPKSTSCWHSCIHCSYSHAAALASPWHRNSIKIPPNKSNSIIHLQKKLITIKPRVKSDQKRETPIKPACVYIPIQSRSKKKFFPRASSRPVKKNFFADRKEKHGAAVCRRSRSEQVLLYYLYTARIYENTSTSALSSPPLFFLRRRAYRPCREAKMRV